MNKSIFRRLNERTCQCIEVTLSKNPVKAKLRILLLEDKDADAELIAHELRASGFDFQLKRIQSEPELRREIATNRPDLILSDHGLPSFDGFRALKLTRDLSPGLPFIFVSASNNRGMVSRMHEEGATDYVFKNDLHDLSQAVRDALKPPSLPALEVQPTKPSTIVIGSTRLWLCPSCFQARDEQYVMVDFLEYARKRNEILVQHELCAACRTR